MLSEQEIKTLTTIVELIEDKRFPARRNITDYVLELIEPYEKRKEMDVFIENLYKTYQP